MARDSRMGKMSRISIIIPAYNVEKYIQACLSSVKVQSNPEFECIVVDDGSTDETLDIIRQTVGEDDRFKIYHHKNQGVSEARNVAISHAHGQYLMFLDGDDLLQENAVEIVLKDIEDNVPDVVLYPMQSYYEREESKHEIRYREWQLSQKECTGSEALADCIHKDNFMFAVWQTVVKTSYVRENEYVFKRGIVHEDELWLTRIIGNAAIVRMGSKAYYLNRGGRVGGITQSHNIKKEYDKCTVIDELLKETTNRELVIQKCEQLEYSLLRIYREYVAEDHDRQLYKAIQKRCNGLRKSRNVKYRLMWVMCRLIGVRNTSNIIHLINRK